MTLIALLAIVLAVPLQAENERVCWLSDLDLTKVEQTWGFFIQKDKNYRSKPLSIAGKIYERGFQTVFGGEGVEGTFELELKPGVQRFQASVGINDEPDFRGSVEFLVYGDTELLWLFRETPFPKRGGKRSHGYRDRGIPIQQKADPSS